MTLLHMGALHPIEQVLTLLLAFGPFVLLGLVIWLRHREGSEVSEGPTADEGTPTEQVAPDHGPATAPGGQAPPRASQARPTSSSLS